MWKLIATALAVTAAGAAAAASFEGVIDSKIGVVGDEDSGGKTRMYVSGQGLRMETQAAVGEGSKKVTALFLQSKPSFTYFVDDEKKTYSEIERLGGQAGNEEREKVTVKKLPAERVAGFICRHALIVAENGEGAEIWVTKALGGAEAFWAAQAGGRDTLSRLAGSMKTMRASGLDGWPLKLKTHPARGGSFVWEAVKVERKKLPSSLFSLSGYTKSEAGAGATGLPELTPQQQRKVEEARKRQQEAMKKVPPEPGK